MQYKFYDTKVEYTDGFLIKNKKNIPYSRITDSMQGQTIVERLFGFGHITLETASNNLSMKYIQNSEENFEKINHIIHEGPKSAV